MCHGTLFAAVVVGRADSDLDSDLGVRRVELKHNGREAAVLIAPPPSPLGSGFVESAV
jgi:hypothetical protein